MDAPSGGSVPVASAGLMPGRVVFRLPLSVRGCAATMMACFSFLFGFNEENPCDGTTFGERASRWWMMGNG